MVPNLFYDLRKVLLFLFCFSFFSLLSHYLPHLRVIGCLTAQDLSIFHVRSIAIKKPVVNLMKLFVLVLYFTSCRVRGYLSLYLYGTPAIGPSTHLRQVGAMLILMYFKSHIL